jgi:hypothetical protein
MPVNRISFFVLWLSSAALIVCLAIPHAAIRPALLIILYALLVLSGTLLDMPWLDKSRKMARDADLLFFAVFALLIYSILAPITINRTGLIQGDFLSRVAPISQVLLIDIASLMSRRRPLCRSPLLIAGLVLAASPGWAVPLLAAAHKLQGESAMLALLYWVLYLPMGLCAIALALLRYFIPSAAK